MNMDLHIPANSYGQEVTMSVNPSTVMCAMATILASLVWLYRRSQLGLPPGPPFYVPGLGHLSLLVKDPLKKLRDLRQKYGDIFRIYLGSRLVVVINGYDAISHVFQSRGAEFAHRPPIFLAEKMAEYKGILNTSGPAWTEQRSNVMRTLRVWATKGGHLDHVLDKEMDRLSKTFSSLIQDGGATNVDLKPFVTRSTCSIAFSMVYGRFLDYDSKELKIYTEVLDELFGHFGLLAMLNFLPFVSHLPGDPVCYHKCIKLVEYLETEVVKPEIQRLIQEQKGKQGGVDSNGNIVKSPVTDGGDYNYIENCTSRYLGEMYHKQQNNISTEMSEEQLIKVAGDMIAGGYESTSTTLLWVVLYLIHHPEVQERCRKEALTALESCGGHVTDVNKADLVYTQATIMEVQRLANIGPLPPAHCCANDTTIQGYTIPKNTIILANFDSLMMSPEVGDFPESFIPERFMDDNGKLKHHKWFIPFSTGTRMCVGSNIAKKELLIFTVRLLTKFRFGAPLVQGQEVMPNLEGNLGLTHVPKPFTVRMEAV